MTENLLRISRRETARAGVIERRLERYHPRFHGAVRALAMRHSRVADLAASFPALLFALAVPRPGLDRAPALARVVDGRSLAEAAAAADLPLWLRKLPPEAFAAPIAPLPDGELFRRQIGHHLPHLPKLMPGWLQVVADIFAIAHEPAALWVAREFVREPRKASPARLRLIGLWSWFSLQPETFGHELMKRPWTPDMSLATALEAAEEWRTMIALHLDLGAEPIADTWLRSGHMAGYDFLPLTSLPAIVEEAETMRNCLKNYGPHLAHNHSRLWSVRQNGERVATLRICCRAPDPLLTIIELEAAGNTKAPREVWWAARQWLHAHDLLQVNIDPRRWGSVPPDRDIWRSLWRPYWLARRRIPEWLPLAPDHKALRAL